MTQVRGVTFSFNVKPPSASPTAAALAACTPIHVSSLRENSTHCQRILRGTLAVLPNVLTATHTLLEDEHGDLVHVSTGLGFTQLKHTYCWVKLGKAGTTADQVGPEAQTASEWRFIVVLHMCITHMLLPCNLSLASCCA